MMQTHTTGDFGLRQQLRRLMLTLLALIGYPALRRPSSTIVRVLYIKPDHLGDLLLATPVLAALRQMFPSAKITALVGPWAQPVLLRNPNIDVVQICRFPGFTRTRKSSLWQPYLELFRSALLLRREQYDLAIIGRDDHWWGAALTLLAGIPLRIGFAVPECQPFLTIEVPWDRNAHVTEQGLALIEAAANNQLGDLPTKMRQSALPAHFVPSTAEQEWVDRWLAEHLMVGQGFAVIHPGTAGTTKLWPAQHWATVATQLQSQGLQVVLTGGPDEKMLVEAIIDHMPARPLTLVGQTSLGQLAALFKRAKVVLGVDSGPLHLAVAQRTPTLHLYGPSDAKRYGPWGRPDQHVVMSADLWCRPCGVFDACPRALERPECMEGITASTVSEAALRLSANASVREEVRRGPSSSAVRAVH